MQLFKRPSRLKPAPWRTRKLQNFFFFTPSLPCYLPKKVLSAGAWLGTAKSDLIIHGVFFPYMHAVGLPLFTDLASMPSQYHLAEGLVSGT